MAKTAVQGRSLNRLLSLRRKPRRPVASLKLTATADTAGHSLADESAARVGTIESSFEAAILGEQREYEAMSREVMVQREQGELLLTELEWMADEAASGTLYAAFVVNAARSGTLETAFVANTADQ